MIEKKSNICFFLIIVGVLFFSIRNANPLINPSIYAEDGVWVAEALTHGWFNTFLHAREDYFVFINLLLLFISTFISTIISGSPLLLLAQSIAIVSYFFYAVISVAMYSVVKNISDSKFAILIYALVILLPLGQSQSEIIGRLLQVGFYIPVLTVCLIIYRAEAKKKSHKNIIDLIIFLSAATNPVVFAIVGTIYLCTFIASDNKISVIKDLLPLTVSMVVLVIIIIPRLNGSGGISNYSYNSNNLIEMLTARLILYPLVFPWYDHLNNKISILLTFLYFLFCGFVIYKTHSKVAKNTLLMILCTLIIVVLSTSIGRVGLTGILNDYQVTFPDRYFYGANVLSIFLFVACLSQCNFSIFIKRFSCVLSVIIIFLYVLNINLIIQDYYSKMNVGITDNFIVALCNAKKIDDYNSVIEIQPSGWEMRIPTSLISQVRCF